MEIVVKAPVNIALIKYWGKRNEDLILPLNDSISVNIDALVATTKVTVGSCLMKDEVQINGKTVDLKEATRFQNVFKEARALCGGMNWNVHIDSTTNFPVAAGLASSAAGFAAIASGLGHLFNMDTDNIARLARIGSGSACRSVFGGFSHWRAGNPDNKNADGGCQSIAETDYWKELRAIVVVLDEKEKRVGSSVGMRNTVETSSLLMSRVNVDVPQRVKELKDAIARRDFAELARITMKESNQLHAVCMDTFPPLNYLNDDSRRLIEFVHAFNASQDPLRPRLAYTFDAGPNCCLLMESDTMPAVLASLQRCFRFDTSKIHPINPENGDMNENDSFRATGQDSTYRSSIRGGYIPVAYSTRPRCPSDHLQHSRHGAADCATGGGLHGASAYWRNCSRRNRFDL